MPLELASKAAGVLAQHGIESARLEAELLLAAALAVNRLDLYLQFDRPVGDDELAAYRRLVRRRLRREPIQYILGETQFRHLLLRVDRRVLIPRPETEVLVGAVLSWARERQVRLARGLCGLDVGTGSGAIALSLLQEGGCARMVATDASADALDVARGNAVRHGLAAAIEFRHGRVWEPIGDERFDIIVSNPPYVAPAEAAQLAPEIVEYEPHDALFAGQAGYEVLNELAAGAADRLQAGGLLAVETGMDQAAAVAAALECGGRFEAVEVVSDLARRPRVVLATRLQ